jgi:hypothetical protein
LAPLHPTFLVALARTAVQAAALGGVYLVALALMGVPVLQLARRLRRPRTV